MWGHVADHGGESGYEDDDDSEESDNFMEDMKQVYLRQEQGYLRRQSMSSDNKGGHVEKDNRGSGN